MFVKSEDSSLVFIKSNNIKVFPCGRRRSTLVDGDKNAGTVLDKYYIPFDPEARLNTEANNRKHSGLNGFKQNYLYEWDESSGKLSFVLAGYLFDIQLEADYMTPMLFGQKMSEFFGASNAIFVKIRLEDAQFFSGASGIPEALTEVLRNQTSTQTASSSLDILIEGMNAAEPNNYYFSGLSLTSALTTSSDTVSLRLLEKVNGAWQICESSRLPSIDHGSAKNSIKVGTVEADSVQFANGLAPAMKLVETSSGVFQLQFTINK